MNWRIFGALAGALAVVGVAVALIAPAGGRVLDPVAQAANATTSAGTAAFDVNGHVTAAGRSIAISGNGAIDLKNNRARMSTTFPVPGFGSLKTDGLFDGRAVYMHLPDSLTRQIPLLGKPWVKLDVGALAKSSGVDLTQGNPAALVQALGAIGSSAKLGRETLGGVATTHYRSTIDPKKALNKIPGGQGSGVLNGLLAKSGVGAIPIDVWIDGGGRVRRESIKFAASGTSLDLTVNFTRFGVRVDSTPPPGDQVLDAGALLGS